MFLVALRAFDLVCMSVPRGVIAAVVPPPLVGAVIAVAVLSAASVVIRVVRIFTTKYRKWSPHLFRWDFLAVQRRPTLSTKSMFIIHINNIYYVLLKALRAADAAMQDSHGDAARYHACPFRISRSNFPSS